jgi:hypothetical protein
MVFMIPPETPPAASSGLPTSRARAAAYGQSARAGRREQTHRERVQAFVAHYKQTGDPVASMMAAGLSRGQTRELIETHPELREDICLTLARGGVTPKRVIEEIARIALCDPRQLFDGDGKMRPINEWPEDVARAVSGVDASQRSIVGSDEESTVVETTYKPRFWDKPQMLRELVRMLRLVAPEQLEVGAGVAVINKIEVVVVAPGQAAIAGPAGLIEG